METEFIVMRTRTIIAVCEVEKGKVPTVIRSGVLHMMNIPKFWDKLAPDSDEYRWTLAYARGHCRALNASGPPQSRPPHRPTLGDAQWISEHQLGEKA